MTLKLRPARPADASALTGILHSGKGSWGYPDDKMVEFRAHWAVRDSDIEDPAQTFLVAEIVGVPVGFLSTRKHDDTTLLVDNLFIDPSAQGKGLGCLLLKRAEDQARTQNLTRLYLESDLHAAPFYERRGFEAIATRPSQMMPGKDMPLMEKRLPSAVHRLEHIDLRVSPSPWAFEVANQADIDAHFETTRKRLPKLWNGRTLKLVGYGFEEGVFRGECADCSFAAYLAWRDWGAPDPTAFNLFGSAVLRTSDDALLYGVMAAHTATAGHIYPPGGNLDPSDVLDDGRVDVEGAIYRELEEETGLTGRDVDEREFLVAFDGPRISISRVFEVARTAESLRADIIRHSLASAEQELADVRIMRSAEDLKDPAIIPYARAIGAHLLTQGSNS